MKNKISANKNPPTMLTTIKTISSKLLLVLLVYK